jgi:hypothetical protein
MDLGQTERNVKAALFYSTFAIGNCTRWVYPRNRSNRSQCAFAGLRQLFHGTLGTALTRSIGAGGFLFIAHAVLRCSV